MNVKKVILEGVKYKGTRELMKFSGSQFGNTLLQNYLLTIYDIDPDQEVGQATIGSIFHKGMEQILKEQKLNIKTELDVEAELPNGWIIRGTLDAWDAENSKIYDWKLTKKYAAKSVAKDMNHPYRLQMSAYAWALAKQNGYSLSGIRNRIVYFFKDADPLMKEDALVEEELAQANEFEELAIAVTDQLQGAIESGEVPEKCEDVWLRKTKAGNLIASRCQVYCSAKDVCPYYSKPQTRETISNW